MNMYLIILRKEYQNVYHLNKKKAKNETRNSMGRWWAKKKRIFLSFFIFRRARLFFRSSFFVDLQKSSLKYNEKHFETFNLMRLKAIDIRVQILS